MWVPIANTTRSNLLVLLDHPDPEILILNYTETSERPSGKLNIKHQVSLDERGSRPAEFCLDAIVHPFGAFAVASCYTGILKLVTVESGEVVDIQIPELNLLSFNFLPLVNEEEQHTHTYAIALFHLDYHEHIQLISRTLTISSETGPALDSTTIDVEYSFSHQRLYRSRTFQRQTKVGCILSLFLPQMKIQMKVKVVWMRRKTYSSEESLWLEEVGF
ncbi:hypothetical protein DFJ43DRAFT_277071 [Lentinula guzmanii]|uniref:Uncharacterized protein n=1 Tax=Lentinula guzmanii TaxID=2804957 RepID=A0AA38JD87_9AGAR|nr:hypothetical protein DFJ43DRAFT_277071 [Lentinula guzmanii]